MPNSLQSSAIASPASRRATNCSLSSIAAHSLQGITPSPLRGKVSPMCPVQCVTYVSGRSGVQAAHTYVSGRSYAAILTCPFREICLTNLFANFGEAHRDQSHSMTVAFFVMPAGRVCGLHGGTQSV